MLCCVYYYVFSTCECSALRLLVLLVSPNKTKPQAAADDKRERACARRLGLFPSMDQKGKPSKMANGKHKNGNEKKPKKKIKPWSSKKKSVSEEVIIGKLRSQYQKVSCCPPNLVSTLITPKNKSLQKGILYSLHFQIDPKKIKHFKDLPLSDATQQGLKDHGFTEPTEIQRESIGLSLKGQDILGAAKTGSGKTLAFLIPVSVVPMFPGT